MKRGKLKKSPKNQTQAICKHKFIDSTACLKCGWTPPEEISGKVELAKPTLPFSFRVTIHYVTRLRLGDVIIHDGVEQVVCQINSSCARITPLGSLGTKAVSFTPRFADKPVTFNAPVQATVTAISANAECTIIRRLGRNWRDTVAKPVKSSAINDAGK